MRSKLWEIALDNKKVNIKIEYSIIFKKKVLIKINDVVYNSVKINVTEEAADYFVDFQNHQLLIYCRIINSRPIYKLAIDRYDYENREKVDWLTNKEKKRSLLQIIVESTITLIITMLFFVFSLFFNSNSFEELGIVLIIIFMIISSYLAKKIISKFSTK